jgi:transcriptional regulator with XRE-family HTH domain
MLNTSEIALRIKKIMDYRKLNSASFAELINVPRSAISHILSERNKPSLEFVLKIEAAFPEVDLQWLLHGYGKYPKTVVNPSISSESIKVDELEEPKPRVQKSILNIESVDVKNVTSTKKEIVKIVIFYKDQSFECFES